MSTTMNEENSIPIAYKGDEPSIFISYSHRDADQVFPILRKMMGDGFRIWFDEGISAGTEWAQNIAIHVKTCEYFIAFVSANYITSDNCCDELSYARDLQKDRLLIYLEPTELPDGLMMRLNRTQAIHWYNYSKAIDRAYMKLYETNGIDRCREVKPEPAAVEPEPTPVAAVSEEKSAPQGSDTNPTAEKKAKPTKKKKVKDAAGNGKKKSKKGLIAIPVVILLAVILFIVVGGRKSKPLSYEDRMAQMTHSATWVAMNQKAEPIDPQNPILGVWADDELTRLGAFLIFDAEGTGIQYKWCSDVVPEDYVEFTWEIADTTLIINRDDREDFYAYKGGDQLEVLNYTYVRSPLTSDEAVEFWQHQSLLRQALNQASYGNSREDIIKNLMNSDYTEEEASYGIDYWDIDWNVQAVRAADNYCENYKRKFRTRERVIESLRNRGFTLEQATYGADNCTKVKK